MYPSLEKNETSLEIVSVVVQKDDLSIIHLVVRKQWPSCAIVNACNYESGEPVTQGIDQQCNY